MNPVHWNNRTDRTSAYNYDLRFMKISISQCTGSVSVSPVRGLFYVLRT